MNTYVRQAETIELMKRPFIGKSKHLKDTILSLDHKWYVEFWVIRYYFLGLKFTEPKRKRLDT